MSSSYSKGHCNPNYKNVRKNAREQRLQFMNSQAELIAQKKREIEEKLAAKQQLASPSEATKAEVSKSVPDTVKETPAPSSEDLKPAGKSLPFKNDGSFLEQFKQLQQQKLNLAAASSPKVSSNPPPTVPLVDVSVPPPTTTFFQGNQYPPPHYPPPSQYASPPPAVQIKKEPGSGCERSPSPYSPSRPCEDEDDVLGQIVPPPVVVQHQPQPQSAPPLPSTSGPTFIVKDYHHEPSGSSKSKSSVMMDSGSFSQSGLDVGKRKFKEEPVEDRHQQERESQREKKRASRWGPEAQVKIEPMIAAGPSTSYQRPANPSILAQSPLLSRITSADPQILTYAVRVFGTTDLTEDQWKQCMDQVKMQYVYQEMLKKKQERERLEMAGKVRYEYDSDEDTEGGTWEHKRRMAEMEKTKQWADQLTENGRGKHHLSHFLPPEELAKFMEKFQAVREGRVVDDSDYKDFKIAESNVGYQMLKKFGWSEGEGLGIGGSGITAPVNAVRRNEAQGLGAARPEELTSEDNEYDAYRKRMMLAYRFRPNPLNNPRRSYY